MAGTGVCRVCGVELPRPNGAYCDEHRPAKDRKGGAKKVPRETSSPDAERLSFESPEVTPQDLGPPKASKQDVDAVLVFFVGLALSGMNSLVTNLVTRPLVKLVNETSDDPESDQKVIDDIKAASRMTQTEQRNVAKFGGSLLAETGIAETAVIQFMAMHPESLPALVSIGSWVSRNMGIRRDIKALTLELRKANNLQEEAQRGVA